MKKKKKAGSIIIIIGLFIILYNPPLFTFNCMHIVGAVSILYLAINNFRIIKGEFAKWLELFVCVAIYLALIVVALHGNSFSGVVFPIYYLVDIIPFTMAVKTFFDKNRMSYDEVIYLFFAAAVIQCLLAILAFINPEIQKLFVNRIIGFSGIEIYNYWSSLRMYGFSNGLMFEMPAVQTILALIAIYFSSKKGWKYVILGGLLFFSAVINARTSIIVLLVGLIILILFSKQSIINKFRILTGIVIASIVLVTFVLPFIKTTSPLTYNWISEGMEDIFGLFHGNRETGYFSYVTNSNRYTLPPTMIGLLFGEGTTISGGYAKYGVYSDLGFINDIWVGGLLYVAVLYSFVIARILKLYKTEDEFNKFLSVLLISLIFILNFKGRMFAMNSVLNLTVVIQLLLSSGKDYAINNGQRIA